MAGKHRVRRKVPAKLLPGLTIYLEADIRRRLGLLAESQQQSLAATAEQAIAKTLDEQLMQKGIKHKPPVSPTAADIALPVNQT